MARGKKGGQGSIKEGKGQETKTRVNKGGQGTGKHKVTEEEIKGICEKS